MTKTTRMTKSDALLDVEDISACQFNSSTSFCRLDFHNEAGRGFRFVSGEHVTSKSSDVLRSNL